MPRSQLCQPNPRPTNPNVWSKTPWALLLLLSLSLLGGCKTTTLQDARVAEQNKRFRDALWMYKSVAERDKEPHAALARASRIRLLTQQEKWPKLLEETASLVNFLDKEDAWYLRFHGDAQVWGPSQQAIEGALVMCGRQANTKASIQGDPMAFAAVVRCFGLYLEHFPRGAHHAEALLRRGEALAIRDGCLPALPWLRKAGNWSPPASPPKTNQSILPHKQIRYFAKLDTLRCEMRLWQRYRDEPKHPRWRDPIFRKRSFDEILRDAGPLLKEHPSKTAQALMQQADILLKKRAFTQSLQTLMHLIQNYSHLPEIKIAQMQALQVFGQTEDWTPLLAAIPQPTPAQAKEVFWQRMKTLALIHGMRTAQALLKRGQTFQAVEMFIKVHKLTAGHPQANTALYQAALALESRNALPKARELYKRIYKESPYDPLALRAWFRYATLLKKERKFLEAGRSFERLAHLNPMHMITPRAYYNAYLSYQEQGLEDEARRIRRILRRQYPLSMEAKQLKRPTP
ncbi:MAG: tetratricopeptide repeat protein [Myxococcales bacterium]|nr:tetratricopeptide repeat protein [Myxococcales bacterium]